MFNYCAVCQKTQKKKLNDKIKYQKSGFYNFHNLLLTIN